jgi:hypothetical protein
LRVFSHDGLTGHSASHAESDTQNAANGLRSHFRYAPQQHP